jgi:phosphoribosylaminoimidazole-succinocarboxamide synthase
MTLITDILRRQLDHCLSETKFSGIGTRYQGKVRDTYRTDDHRLVLITTDRISAFDHVLPQPIPFKGQVLNQLAAYFFERTDDIIANHMIGVPDPNVTIARACAPIPIEFVVRGYLAGHAWREYGAGARSISGKPLPDGLVQNSRLPEPILTPATKAESGHDEDINREEILKQGILDAETFDFLEEKSLELFDRGTEMAARQDLILVDTKYEFGYDETGNPVLIDEVHTPDSSRYFYADGYKRRLRNGQPQRQLSKEFVREWLMDRGFQGKEDQEMPDLPEDFRVKIAQRYIELFEEVTGDSFEPDTHPDPAERIRKTLLKELQD